MRFVLLSSCPERSDQAEENGSKPNGNGNDSLIPGLLTVPKLSNNHTITYITMCIKYICLKCTNNSK